MRRVPLLLGGLFVAVPLACAPVAPPPVVPAPAVAPPTLSDADWGRFRSERQGLSIPLPEGKLWRIDDHSSSWLDAVHPPTQSRVRARAWLEPKPVNQAGCQAEARRFAPDLPVPSEGSVVDQFESSDMFASGFASRVVVGIDDADPKSGEVGGYVLAVGVEGRRCIAMVFTARGTGAKGEVLGERLGLGTRIVESTVYLSRLPGEGPLEPVGSPVRPE